MRWSVTENNYINDFWEHGLGVVPDNIFQDTNFEHKCYNCYSYNVERFDADPFSDKFRCIDCGYYTYVQYSDSPESSVTEIAVSMIDCMW